MGTDSPPQYILVVCPKCHERMHARREHAGRRVACPECQTQTTIPQPPAVPVAPKPVEREDRPRPQQQRNSVPAATTPTTAPKAEPPKFVLVKCKVCGTRMHPRAENAGRKIRCPDCETLNDIPEYVEPRPTNTAPDLVIGEYDVGLEPPKPDFMPKVLPSREPVVYEVIPDPPRWTMFSGVYGFPWREGVVIRWLYVTTGLLLIQSLFLFLVGVLEAYGAQHASIVAVGSYFLGFFFLAVWTLSYAAASASVIIQETAEGADNVADWPSDDWREWFFHLLYLLFMVGLSAGAGWGARIVAEQSDARPEVTLLVFGITAFLVFPIVWLSTLERGSPLVPFSAPVLASLFRVGWAWILFYLQTGFWLACLVATTIFLARYRWALLLTAPLAAAYFLIYVRLMGRMGWLIVDRLGTARDDR